MMGPRLRKLALTAHVTASVGWLGAVAAFLALAVVGLATSDALLARGAYLAMDVVAWTVIVPLCFAAFATGLVQSFGTEWGLARHYWVLAKLAITVASTLLLLLHMRPIETLADAAAADALGPGHRPLQVQLVANAAAAVLAIALATALSVYKPKGMTRRGRRWLRTRRAQEADGAATEGRTAPLLSGEP